MNRTERNRKTDQAWNKLYNRLNKDGLVPVTNSRQPLYPLVVKWGAVAAVVICCVCISITYFMESEDEKRDMLTQRNDESGTLVTALEDGSIVYLEGRTTLQYPEHFSSEKREVGLQGNALFDVTGNRERPFIIETQDVQIEVLGTAFNVRSRDNSPFELSVQRGKVRVTLKKNGQDIYVKAGETATLLSQKLHLSNTTDDEQFQRYTKNMRFKDQRLADIIRAINLREQEINLQTSLQLGGRRLTVTFSDNTPETITELICVALNLKYKREGDTFILYE